MCWIYWCFFCVIGVFYLSLLCFPAAGEGAASVRVLAAVALPGSRGCLSPEPGGRGSLVRDACYRFVARSVWMFVVVVTYVRRCHQNRESTQIYANREPIYGV